MTEEHGQGQAPKAAAWVGLVGAGRMGRGILQGLLSKGTRVAVWDTFPSARQAARELGAAEAAGPADLARRARIIIFSLPSPREVEDVVAGPEGIAAAMEPGTVLVDTTTGDPATSRSLAEAVAAGGGHYVDAPILGRPEAALRWTLPVGGPPAVVEGIRPVLEQFAGRIVHVGPVGSGMALKLLNNTMFAVINAVTAEVMAACRQVGIEPGAFLDIVGASEAATVSPLFKSLAGKIVRDEFDPVFSVDLLAKDLRLALKMYEDHGVPAVMGRTVQMVVDMALAQGYGPRDSAALVRVFENLRRGGAPATERALKTYG